MSNVDELRDKEITFLQGDIASTVQSVSSDLLLDKTNYELWYNLGQILYLSKAYEVSLFCMRKSLRSE
jgi:hypothetical protein